jgi:DNA-binding MarR family transcriptional regulator
MSKVPGSEGVPVLSKSGNSGKSADDTTKQIARDMRRLMQYLDTHSRQLLKHQDITVPQVMCLDELRDRGALPVAVLANAIHLSPSTTVGIIDRLEKKKLVKRNRSDTDRRSVFVEITELGRNFVVASPHLLHNRLKSAMKRLPEQEQEQICDCLKRLAHLLSEDNQS